MQKLIRGIVEFRKNVQESYREMFGRLATGQAPDTLFVACSDSRVVPNTFASTNPGDLFVLRNMGNIVPPSHERDAVTSDESEGAAIEFSMQTLHVNYIVVCGHSECGAMYALLNDRKKIEAPNMKNWLRHGDEAVKRLQAGLSLDPNLSKSNQLSQLNVLLQMENIASYPDVKQRIADGKLTIHGWWFDIGKADVYSYDKKQNRFVLIDDIEAERLLQGSEN